MSEAAAPAPVAAPAAGATEAPVDAKVDAPVASPAPDPKDLWKKAVAGKTFKFKGVEKSLADIDPDEAVEHLRRGFGANEVVAEAKKTKAEAESVLSLRKRLAEGSDDEALDALVQFGGERGLKLLDSLRSRISSEQEQLSKLSDGERQHYEARQRAEQELEHYRKQEAQRKQEEAQREEQSVAAQVKQEAMTKAASLAKLLKGFPASKVDALGPHIARAWQESISLGMELGRDVSPDALVKRAEELFKASTHDFYGGMTPEEQFEFLGEEQVRKLSALLVSRLRGNVKPAPAKVAPAAPSRTSTEPMLGDPRYFSR
jgi:hypothetical protein